MIREPDETEPASRPRWYVLGLAASAAVAACLRIVNIVVIRPSCPEDLVERVESGSTAYNPAECEPGTFAIWGDSAYGYLQARLLADGQGFVDGAIWLTSEGQEYPDSAVKPPLYTVFLALFSRVGLTSVTSHRLLSAALGVLAVVLIGLIARRLAGHRAGVLAAALAAVYPMLWINDGMLQSESLFIPMVCLTILAAYRFWDRPSWASAALLGLAVGAAALTRGEAALLGLVVVPLLWGMRGTAIRRRLGFGACAAATVLAVCSPWFAYNLSRFEEPVFMIARTGSVLSAANCDSTYYGDRLGHWDDCMSWYLETGRVEQIPDPEILDESQRDLVPRDAAIEYMRDNIGRLPVVMAARVARMWDLYRPGQNIEMNAVVEGRGERPSQAGAAMYFLMLPFAVAGAVVLWRRRVPLSPLLIVPVSITVTAAATFGLTRYRSPADAVLVALAAVAITWLVGRRWPEPGGGDVRSRPERSQLNE